MGGGMFCLVHAHTPLQDLILSFPPKSTHVGGQWPPNGLTPTTGNPGSTIELGAFWWENWVPGPFFFLGVHQI